MTIVRRGAVSARIAGRVGSTPKMLAGGERQVQARVLFVDQDAINRQSVLRDERLDALDRRTEPPRSRGSSARTRASAESDGAFACGS